MKEYLIYMALLVGGVTVLVIFVAAITAFIRTREEGDFREAFYDGLDFFVGTDNRRWAVLLGIAIFTTFMALTHPGDGLLKSFEEKIQNDPLRKELDEVEERHYNLRDYGLYKTNPEMCVTSNEFRENNSHICEPKKEVRSWVWWWIAITIWIFLLIYTIPAFWDDIMRAGRRTYARLRAQAGGEARFRPGNLIDRLFGRRRRPGRRGRFFAETAPEGQAPPQAPAPGAGPQQEMNFWKVVLASLVPEILINLVEWFSPRRRRT